jgi:hypothetical protein
MTTEKLKEILEKHKKWLNDEDGGVRAEFYGNNLSGINMCDADLRYAIFVGVDLSHAILKKCKLSYSVLCGITISKADISFSNMSFADMSIADMRGTNLDCTDLHGARLCGTILQKASLKASDLSVTDLRGADLRDANLTGANLNGAHMENANLRGANLDYSVLPLWCGSLKAHFDEKQIIQFIYHVTKAGLYSKNVSPKLKEVLKKLTPIANKFHRAVQCGEFKSNDYD